VTDDIRAALPSWSALAHNHRAARDDDLTLYVDELAPHIAEASGFDLWRGFVGVEDALAEFAVLSDAVRLLNAFGEAVQRAVRVAERAVIDPEQAAPAVSLLHILNVAACMGRCEDGDADAGRARDWLTAVAGVRSGIGESTRREAAFAALGFGLPHLAVELLDAPDLPDRVEPGRPVGPALGDFVWYVAAAQRCGLDRDAVAPAWRDFVTDFPMKLEVGTASWPGLVAAGRAVHAVLGGEPVGTVVNLIRADLP